MEQINLHNYEAFLLDYFEGNLNEETIANLKNFILAHPELEIDLEDTDWVHLDRVEEGFDFKNNLKKINEGKDDDLIIAYLENHLTTKQKSDFEKRLSKDEQLTKQLNDYRKTILNVTEETVTVQKAWLYKNEDDLILNNQHLIYLEGLLSSNEKINFETKIKSNPSLQKEFSAYQKAYLSVDASVQFPDKASLKKETKVFVLFSFSNLQRLAAVILLLVGFFLLYQVYKPVSTQKINAIAVKLNSIKKPFKIQFDSKQNSNPIQKENSVQIVHSNQLHKKEILPAALPNNLDSTESFVNQTQNLIHEPIIKDTLNKTLVTNLININSSTKTKIDTNFIAENEVQKNKNIFTLANIETEKDADENSDNSNKNKFWKKLLNISNKAKNIGIKGIEAEQKENRTYSFAFNNLSVEKK